MNEVPMYITQHRGEILSRYEKDMFDILSKICYRLEPDEIMEGITLRTIILLTTFIFF